MMVQVTEDHRLHCGVYIILTVEGRLLQDRVKGSLKSQNDRTGQNSQLKIKGMDQSVYTIILTTCVE